jgi:hypothetical protein
MTKSKKKEKPLTVEDVVVAIKEVLLETINRYIKEMYGLLGKTNKKIDRLHEAIDRSHDSQKVIINKLREHERRLQELEKDFLEN